MVRSDDLLTLPAGLPEPVDDGAADHLPGMRLPPVALAATAGDRVELAGLRGRTVVYCYPRTGRPDQELPPGWNEIPGARGCTPQSCGFRDHHAELAARGARVFGLSTQETDYQQEVVARLHLPFPLLSDAELELARALRLPTFVVEGMTLLRRLTMIVDDGRIAKVFYPVFPPDADAVRVVAWLEEHGGAA
jgi:peroxiredoxin